MENVKQKLSSTFADIVHSIDFNPKTLINLAVTLVAISSIFTSLKVMSLQDQIVQLNNRMQQLEQSD